MLEANRHPNIEILSYSEVVEVDGYIGNFRAKVKRNSRFVSETKCTGCGACADACPFNTEGMIVRLDEKAGVCVKCDLCGGAPKCAEVCPTDALTYILDRKEVSGA